MGSRACKAPKSSGQSLALGTRGVHDAKEVSVLRWAQCENQHYENSVFSDYCRLGRSCKLLWLAC